MFWDKAAQPQQNSVDDAAINAPADLVPANQHRTQVSQHVRNLGIGRSACSVARTGSDALLRMSPIGTAGTPQSPSGALVPPALVHRTACPDSPQSMHLTASRRLQQANALQPRSSSTHSASRLSQQLAAAQQADATPAQQQVLAGAADLQQQQRDLAGSAPQLLPPPRYNALMPILQSIMDSHALHPDIARQDQLGPALAYPALSLQDPTLLPPAMQKPASASSTDQTREPGLAWSLIALSTTLALQTPPPASIKFSSSQAAVSTWSMHAETLLQSMITGLQAQAVPSSAVVAALTVAATYKALGQSACTAQQMLPNISMLQTKLQQWTGCQAAPVSVATMQMAASAAEILMQHQAPEEACELLQQLDEIALANQHTASVSSTQNHRRGGPDLHHTDAAQLSQAHQMPTADSKEINSSVILTVKKLMQSADSRCQGGCDRTVLATAGAQLPISPVSAPYAQKTISGSAGAPLAKARSLSATSQTQSRQVISCTTPLISSNLPRRMSSHKVSEQNAVLTSRLLPPRPERTTGALNRQPDQLHVRRNAPPQPEHRFPSSVYQQILGSRPGGATIRPQPQTAYQQILSMTSAGQGQGLRRARSPVQAAMASQATGQRQITGTICNEQSICNQHSSSCSQSHSQLQPQAQSIANNATIVQLRSPPLLVVTSNAGSAKDDSPHTVPAGKQVLSCRPVWKNFSAGSPSSAPKPSNAKDTDVDSFAAPSNAPAAGAASDAHTSSTNSRLAAASVTQLPFIATITSGDVVKLVSGGSTHIIPSDETPSATGGKTAAQHAMQPLQEAQQHQQEMDQKTPSPTGLSCTEEMDFEALLDSPVELAGPNKSCNHGMAAPLPDGPQTKLPNNTSPPRMTGAQHPLPGAAFTHLYCDQQQGTQLAHGLPLVASC